MPINLRYGQQAVARGYLNKQRLDQVLAKQKQLAAQGKKVSVRMILEKAGLLTPQQLQEIDRDLNIKVVKKHTSKVQKPGVRPAAPTGAQNFSGDAVPQFSGMSGADPDATVFSPPPPDMQARVRNERERAKQEARRKQEQEASAFFDDSPSPFGGDPFGGGDMAPEPFGGDMQPEPFGGDMQPEPFGGGFGGEMQPEPFGEMQPEPFGGGSLEPAGFGDDSPFGDDPYGGGYGNEPQELSRMDSSPKLASLGAEYEGLASPDDEQLPTIGGFDDDSMGGFQQPPARGFQAAPPQPAYGGPSLAPAGDDFADFGNDIRSPEELDAAPTGSTRPLGGSADLDATMFSPPPPGIGSSPRQKTGAMDRTVFSPRPPEMGGRLPAEPQPAGDDWGESPGMEAEPFGAEPEPFGMEAEPFAAEPEPFAAEADSFAAEAEPFGAEPESFADEPFAEAPAGGNLDATLFSPPPPKMPQGRRDTGKQRGRQGADDFGDVELPRGKVIDDVPTAPAAMEDVHPLRRGVGTTSSSGGVKRPTEPPRFEEEVAEELPEAAGVDVPDEIPEEMPEEAVPPVGRGKGKLPGKAPAMAGASKRELPKKEVPAAEPEKEKKGAGKRVLLIFSILLLIVVAILTLPIVLYEQVPQVQQLRDHPQAKPVYDYVDYEIFNRIREWTGQPTKPRPSGQPPLIIPTKPLDNSADSPPAPNEEGEPAGNAE